MSASVEDRVISMTFLNSNFLKGVSTTISALSRLQGALAVKPPAGNGLDEVQKSASRFSLQGIMQSTAGVQAAFVAMSTVAITALTNITNRAVDAGLAFAKSFTIGPVMDGLHEYETNLKSIQTVQANTDRPLPEIEGALQRLNEYSDQTIYNFSEMARNVGTFTAAGVDLETSVSSIKGIANLAALSGSSSEQAATAMYQLSQAISSGRVGLQDWNSVVNAGMGGKKLQNALAQTAIAMGDIDAQAVKMEGPMKKLTINGGSFRESIMAKPGQQSWLSSDILVNTLATMDGRFSKAALSAELTEEGLRKYTDAQVEATIADNRAALEKKNGVKYTDEQFKAISKMSTMAFKSATEVKTLGQVFDILKETIGSGWSASFQNIFGGLKDAKKLFTGMSEAVGQIVKDNALARNKVLSAWSEGGGRAYVIEGLKNAWQALLNIAGPIQRAFRSIFPAKTSGDLIMMSLAFKRFTENLIIGEGTMKNLKLTFKGIFAVFSIGISIVKGIAGVILDMFGAMTSGTGGILEFTGGIGEFLVGIDKAIKKGDGFKAFFDGLGQVLSYPIQFITTLVGALFSIGDGADSAGDAMGRVKERFGFLGEIGKTLKSAGSAVSDFLAEVSIKMTQISPVLAGLAKGISDTISELISGGDFSAAFDGLNTALFGGLVLVLRNFAKNGFSFNFDVGGISGMFEQLTGNLQAMQTNLQAKTLFTIAGAVALLTVSIIGLSLIDSAKLTKALTAVGVGFGLLLGAMTVMTKIAGSAGFIKIPQVAIAMVILAGSILILSLAVKVLSTMSWEELAKGMAGLALMLAGLSAAAQAMSGTSGAILRTGLAMIPLAFAVVILAGAMKVFATMKWEEIAKGAVGVVGSLAGIALAMQLMPKSLPITAAGLVLVSGSLILLGYAMKQFADMSWQEMGKGMAAIAGALGLIAIGMSLMPLSLPFTAAGLVLVAGALRIIADVAKIFATMSWEEMGKAAAGLAGAMLIISAGLFLMTGSLAGSAALLVAAAALAVLTPVLLALGAMDIVTIVTALGVLAGVFAILGIAGLLLAPIILPIMGLGAALVLIGAGVALAGAGVLALATAFAIFAAAGAAGIVVIGGLISQVPALIVSFAKGVIGFVVTIGAAAGRFVGAFVKIIAAIITAIMQSLPRIGALFLKIITTALTVIRKSIGQFVSTGMAVLMALLEGISKNIGRITAKASEIIQKFMTALGNESPKLADKGAKMIIKFVDSITAAINNNSAELGRAGGDLAVAIVRGMANGITNGLSVVTDAAKNLANKALNAAKSALGIKSPSKEFKKIGIFVNEGFRDGLVGGLDETKEALNLMRSTLKDGIKGAKADIKAEQDKLKKLMKNPEKNAKQIKKHRDALKTAQNEERKLVAGQEIFNKLVKKNADKIKANAQQLDGLKADLEKRQGELDAAIAARDGFKTSISDQYNTLPEITRSTSVSSYMRNMQQTIAKTQQFQATLASLRAMGMDDTTYKKLLAEGLDAAPFAEKLLASGPGAVAEMNNLNSQLSTASTNLGTQTSNDMYQAGVDTAQGFVNGLNSQIANLEGTMTAMATAMVKAVKKKLKIKSPSRVFAEIGEFSSKGVAVGLKAYSGVAEQAAAEVGENSLAVLKTTMSRVGSVMDDTGVNTTPTVTPVLDLTQLTRDANQISSLVDISPIKADVSFGQATQISAESQAAKKAAEAAAMAVSNDAVSKEIKFEQTINSPKPLSPIEVYRATQNQLSFAKEALSST